jgi:RES domain-containing protein
LSSSPAAALLEIFVHFEIQPGKLPRDYKLLEITVPDNIFGKTIQITDLPPNWITEQIATQRIGDAWLEKRSSPLLEAPSAIVPRTNNYLLNPAHPETSRITIASVSQLGIDKRLLRQ